MLDLRHVIFRELMAHYKMKNMLITFSYSNHLLSPILPKKSRFLNPLGNKAFLFKSPFLITDLRGEKK